MFARDRPRECIEMEYWLPVLWFGVIGFGVLMYVVLDGFVLGLGILAPFARDGDQLDHMISGIVRGETISWTIGRQRSGPSIT